MTLNDPSDQEQFRVGGNKYRAPYDRTSESAVNPEAVNSFHKKSDVDSSAKAQHHTIGTKQDQAASGAHDHDGINSKKIMVGVNITGAKGGNVALTNLITALAAALGFTDSTT